MADFYIVIDTATGKVRWRGQGDYTAEVLPEGLVAMPAPPEVMHGADVRADQIKDASIAAVEAMADQLPPDVPQELVAAIRSDAVAAIQNASGFVEMQTAMATALTATDALNPEEKA